MKTIIRFINETLPVPRNIPKEIIRKWLIDTASIYGFTIGDLNYAFCDESYILQVNQEYLHHDYYTDIITFDNTEGSVVGGDILISLTAVVENAQKYNVPPYQELYRLFAHGLLHLMTFNDASDQERANMHRLEDEALNRLPFEIRNIDAKISL